MPTADSRIGLARQPDPISRPPFSRFPPSSSSLTLSSMAKPSREYIYGMNPAFELLRAGRRTVYQAFLNEAAKNSSRMKKLTGVLERQDVPVEWVGKERLRDLSSSKDHQGVVIKTRPYQYVDPLDLMDRERLLLLDNVEDPNNVGAVLRSAEIFGFHGVLLPTRGCPDIYPSVAKVSAGACEYLSIAKSLSANGYVRLAQKHAYVVAALDAKGTTSLDQLVSDKPDRLLLVVGGEDKSVGQFILNGADHILGIPLRGRIKSLNASVAAAIAMHQLQA